MSLPRQEFAEFLADVKSLETLEGTDWATDVAPDRMAGRMPDLA